MTCANDRVVVVRRFSPGATYEVSGYPLGPRGVECQAPAFAPCAEGAGECEGEADDDSFSLDAAYLRKHLCWWGIRCFDDCEPCA